MQTETKRSSYSSLRQASRISLVEQVPLAAPLSIYIEPTNICNFKCTYCPESEDDFKDISGGWFKLHEEQLARILDEVAAMPGPPATLNFYMMGEPMVNKALPEMIRIARARAPGSKLIVTSNASLLTESMATRLIDSGLDFLRISIYGAFEETHRARTQSSIRLRRIIDNLATFRRIRGERSTPFLYVKMIDSQDASENAAFLETFGPLGDEVNIEPVMNWNDIDEKNRSNVDREQMLSSGYFARKKEVCPFPFYSLVIHSDLRVSVCCVDWSKQAVVGDLHDESLLAIWNGPRLRAFQDLHVQRRRHELAACRSCTYLHTAPDRMEDLTWDAWLQRTGGRTESTRPPVVARKIIAVQPVAID